MALQINRTLTTRSGFDVPAGSYVWLQEERATDNKYSALVKPVFFKNKASFEAGKTRFTPQELTDNMLSFYQEFTPAEYASLTSAAIHNYVKAKFETQLGANTVAIVQ